MVTDVADVSLCCLEGGADDQRYRGACVRVAVNKWDQMNAQREVCKLKKQAVGGGYLGY